MSNPHLQLAVGAQAIPKKPKTRPVPITDPAHPSHASALEIALMALKLASNIGPAIVQVVDPEHGQLAAGLGGIANASVDSISKGLPAK